MKPINPDARPEVDLGNLIIGLDADIDKTMSTTNAANQTGAVPVKIAKKTVSLRRAEIS